MLRDDPWHIPGGLFVWISPADTLWTQLFKFTSYSNVIKANVCPAVAERGSSEQDKERKPVCRMLSQSRDAAHLTDKTPACVHTMNPQQVCLHIFHNLQGDLPSCVQAHHTDFILCS